jgi:hypothetical protein
MGIFRTGASNHDEIVVFMGNRLTNFIDSVELIVFSHGIGREIVYK